MGKSKAGRPPGKTNKPEKVIFSIQMAKIDYNELKQAAEDEQRSVSQMAAILLHRGLFPADC
jgi:hypothetical protein